VREISVKLRDYIARLNRVWIEGQVVEVSRRSGSQVYLTVRDVDVDASVSVVIPGGLDRAMNPPLAAGQRVLMHVQCEYWVRNGRLMLRASEIRPVGIGELLATLERRKQQLPAKTGEPWSEDEDRKLLSGFDAGRGLPELAATHQRTQTGVRARLVKYGRLAA
jgi:exonuclease VII large subunit